MWFENLYIIHGIGMAAFLVMALAFQSNVRSHILYLQVFGMAILGVHLYLLGAITGMALMGILAARNLIFLQKDRFPIAGHRFVYYAFLLLVLTVGLLTWEGWGSIFAIGGSLLATYGFWLSEPRRIRKIILLSALTWTPYAIIFKAYPVLLLEIFLAASILIAMWRYDRYPHRIKKMKPTE